ncbi:YraN family protein [Luteolibacter ambystomatis]|uniref:UPF0102 protein KBB96_03150 n=1 Tax=Luteolibacter ambystomatis TaxID=2824561 RepID=A0A975J0Q5_9BACT|nr:YraN family protein [Luteolibacter ambystomatis]QUE51892.1 YraN family protein [Luteolibacter ambystomatis]
MTARDGSPLGRKEIGDFGERVAAAWLRAQGEKVLYRNHRAPRGGEVDIVARKGKLLLFIEVKTRRQGAKIRGYDAVNADKRALIERGAGHWRELLKRNDIPWRFDVIEVTVEEGCKPVVHRIEDAF